jgi:hypothetical protein
MCPLALRNLTTGPLTAASELPRPKKFHSCASNIHSSEATLQPHIRRGQEPDSGLARLG